MNTIRNENIETMNTTTLGPSREIIATFENYADAQRAVDFLSDRRFPVEQVAIVAEGLKFVEQVTGRLGWGKATLSGALSGAVVGALIGFIFGLFSWIEPVISALSLSLYGLIFGAALGAIMGLMVYAFSGGNRDFTSVRGVQADRYNVMVASEHAPEARRLMDEIR